MLLKKATATYKGLAILAIMLCHAAGTFGQGKFVYFTPLGGIGVAIFLLLSGYGLNESWLAASNVGGGTEPHQYWWRKRFIAVWIPYVIVQLIAYWPFHAFELLPFLLDLTLIKPLYHYGWYLQHIFLWYAIFYCVRRVKCLNQYRIIVFSVVSMLFFFLFREIRAEQSLSFLLGIMLSEKKEWQEDLFIIRHGLLFTIFGIACLAVKQFSFIRSAPQIVMNCVQLGIKLPIGFGLVIFCYKLTEKWKWIGTALGAVGTISYELYLIHGYVLSLMPVSFCGVGLFIIGTAAIAIGYWWMMKKLKPVFLKLLRVK